MRAFLSHSSLDRYFVEQVYSKLGAAQSHLDTKTFEKAVLNVEAISKALSNSDVFVLFLSDNSLDSNFVTHESRMAFESLAAGTLRRILIICIDDVSLATVPEFLRKLNIVTQISSPGACYRRIQQVLVQLSVDYDSKAPVFVGRENEMRKLKIELARPSMDGPVVIALAGHNGIGRRTLIKKVFSEVLPAFSLFMQIEMAQGSGVDDLFLQLLRGRGRATLSKLTQAIESFRRETPQRKNELLSAEIVGLIQENETLIIVDAGGLVDESGRYPDYLIDCLRPHFNDVRPVAIFVQVRMTPGRLQDEYDRVAFLRVPPFSFSDTMTLVGLKLKANGIRFDASDHKALAALVDGHAINVDFAIAQIMAQGSNVKLFLKSPTELILWKEKRAYDYVEKLKFRSLDLRIIGALLLFRYLPTELLLEVCAAETADAVEALRRLQDWHVIEFDGQVQSISLPLRDALERNTEFSLSKKEQRAIARIVLNFIQQYRDDDDIPVSLIEPVIVSSLRAGTEGAASQWRSLLLPSHYLMIARESYNAGDYRSAADYCEQALEQAYRMSKQAKVEGLRLKGLCAVRRKDATRFEEAIAALEVIRNKHADAIRLFLEGFRRRLAGDLLGAEQYYLKCHDKNEKNFAVCREISQVYLSLGRYAEAENYARIAYKIAPTNAYVVDIMVGVLLGKSDDPSALASDSEFQYLMNELERYGNGEGKSFYARRQAEYMLRIGETKKARKWADEAVSKTPGLLLPYFIRARVLISRNNFSAAERDLRKMNELRYDSDSEDAGQYVVEIFRIEFDMMTGQKQYRQAFNALERIEHKLPSYLSGQFKKSLAEAIKWDTQFHDPELTAWAKKQ